MDLSIILERLTPSSSYRLTSAVPPHSLLEWRGPEKQPEWGEIEAMWKAIQGETLKITPTLEQRLAEIEKKLKEKEV